MTAWVDYKALQSKGLVTKKATSLADLHARRKQHQGQFWTPSWVSEGIWRLLEHNFSQNGHYSVFDNSVGSGSLLAPAPADRVNVYGCDIDPRCIEHLATGAGKAGFADYVFLADGMENLSVGSMSIAVVNPPFSVHLESPNLDPALPSTTYGRFGPNSSAISHTYAVEQALSAASVTVALLPISMDQWARQCDKLVAVLTLPKDTFKSEAANVRTALYVFDSARLGQRELIEREVSSAEAWPDVALNIYSLGELGKTRFCSIGHSNGAPVIATPVTNDATVTMNHHNRKIVLNFRCGLTEAKVMNSLLVQKAVPEHQQRLPKGISYQGSGRLMLDAYLVTEDPDGHLTELMNDIRKAGGNPVPSPSFLGYWSKLKRKTARHRVPFRHTVKRPSEANSYLVARTMTLLDAGDFNSPPVPKGTRIPAKNLGGEYVVTFEGHTVSLNAQDVRKRFTIDSDTGSGDLEWVLVHEGKNSAYPHLYHQAKRELARAGVDFLWDVQSDAVAEHLVNGTGAMLGWQQGCGKARASVALCLANSGKGLIVVESGLVNEMKIEITKKLNLSPDLWQVIESVNDTRELKKINVVSYNRLKAVIPGTRSKTIAKALRRRVSTVCADEGGLLSNDRTLQSSALKQLSPRRLYIADGTLMANYVREILPIAGYTAGDSTAVQPYGNHNKPFLEQSLMRGAKGAVRGMEAFKDQYMVLDWATHEFADSLQTGAKREIPTLRNVEAFRNFISPLVQRRLAKEPEFAKFNKCPDWIPEVHTIDWDDSHFKHYLKTNVAFAEWFLRHKADRYAEGKRCNFVEVLARLNAVFHACNQPHQPSDNVMGHYSATTSKQRYTVNLIKKRVASGKKVMLFARSPSVVNRLHTLLKEQGIDSLRFTGEQDIFKRTAALDFEFRHGDCPVLLCTYVGQRGLNIPEASSVIFYNRDFGGDTELQSIYRTQRPDQMQSVLVDYVHLPGIDEYMAQMVEWKTRTADAALDWGDGVSQIDEYRHMDDLLEQFCHETLSMSSREAARYLGVA